VSLEDGLFGPCRANLAHAFGDFVVRRADGLYAYHLATVVDDAWLGITEIVRGADLLDLSLAQNYLAGLLGHRLAGHLHLPLAIAADGQKLSKQNGAQPLPDDDPRPSLVAVLEHLGQGPPPGLREAPLDDLWRWAIDYWDPGRLARTPRPAPPL
jgi:glutamyl-Q tRNA(Asp) synthetase